MRKQKGALGEELVTLECQAKESGWTSTDRRAG